MENMQSCPLKVEKYDHLVTTEYDEIYASDLIASSVLSIRCYTIATHFPSAQNVTQTVVQVRQKCMATHTADNEYIFFCFYNHCLNQPVGIWNYSHSVDSSINSDVCSVPLELVNFTQGKDDKVLKTTLRPTTPQPSGESENRMHVCTYVYAVELWRFPLISRFLYSTITTISKHEKCVLMKLVNVKEGNSQGWVLNKIYSAIQ